MLSKSNEIQTCINLDLLSLAPSRDHGTTDYQSLGPAKADFIFGKLPNVGAPDESVEIRTNVPVSPKGGGYAFFHHVQEHGSRPWLRRRLQEPFEKGRNHDHQT